MRIMLIADGRSPITRNWIEMLDPGEHEVLLVSTYPYDEINGLYAQTMIPVGFSRLAGGQVKGAAQSGKTILRKLISIFRPLFMRMRAFLTPMMLRRPQIRLLEYVLKHQPDIVHALRIPFEGMLGSALFNGVPFVLSIWGNDLSMHAGTSWMMKYRTRQALLHADGLMADAASDIQIAKEIGVREHIPDLVVPGSGGLDLTELNPKTGTQILDKYGLQANVPLVINPRGFRPGSVHQDTFFNAIPVVIEKIPEAIFVCPGMDGQPEAHNWVTRLGIEKNTILLPFLPQSELWALYRHTAVYVSLSSHDGTPNSFLEAIARGCFPVVGRIPSLCEWVEDGVNGYLVHPEDSAGAAGAIINALENDAIRDKAAGKNAELIRARADRRVARVKVLDFYRGLLKEN